MVSAHLGGGQHPTVGCCPPGGWVGCAWLAHLTHPPGGIPAHLVGGWGALGLRISPTHQVGNTPQWGVAHPPGGQRPITLEYQIYLPAIDTIVTGMYIVSTWQSERMVSRQQQPQRWRSGQEHLGRKHLSCRTRHCLYKWSSLNAFKK